MNQRLTLLLQFVFVTGVTYLVGAQLAQGIIQADVEGSDASSSSGSAIEQSIQNVNGSSGLEVRPAVGEPEPIDFNLQGSESTQPQGGEDLQQQSSQQLQPNAGIDDFPQQGDL